MRIDTTLGEDVLLLEGFSGVEAISTPFAFHVDLLSEDPAVEASDILRTSALITVDLPDGEKRLVHGVVSRFVQRGRMEDLTSYQCELVPWLQFLSLSRGCRIFQEMSVLEIVEEVFKDQGYSDFDIRCVRSYPKRTYCVQYRETNLNFVSRLLEEEGIFYFFEHTDSEHTLVVADDNTAFEACPGPGEARMRRDAVPGEDVVKELESEHSVRAGKIALTDYDYLQPSMSLRSEISGEEPEEIYDFHPGRYTDPDEGERYARVMLEREEAERQVVHGESTCRQFQGGTHFDLKEHYRRDQNQTYLLTRVSHFARAGDYRSERSTELDYRNDFVAIPHDVPYRPPRRTPKPVVQGSQTAVVVGKKGEEVWVDKYGRIKVQFHWDREGKNDENSSCWVRVASPWAGKGYGSVSVPRIGNEVVVEFLEGDPDRPLVVGSVYNAEQMPPLELPSSGIEMGMKSRSSPGGGGHNQITMNDTKGEEMMTVNAQYDMATTVGNDQTLDVANNRTASVAVDDSETVGSNQTLDVGSDQTVTVGSNQDVTVGADQSLTVSASRSVTVGAGNTVDVGADHGLTAGGKVSMESGTDTGIKAGTAVSLEAGTDMKLDAGVKVEVTAGATIKLSAGGSTVEIGPAGVKITTGAIVDIKGAMVKHNA